MTNAMTFVLNDKMRGKLGIPLLDKVLYLLSQITYNEDEFVDAGFQELVDDDRQNGLACKWYQRLRLCICMRP